MATVNPTQPPTRPMMAPAVGCRCDMRHRGAVWAVSRCGVGGWGKREGVGGDERGLGFEESLSCDYICGRYSFQRPKLQMPSLKRL